MIREFEKVSSHKNETVDEYVFRLPTFTCEGDLCSLTPRMTLIAFKEFEQRAKEIIGGDVSGQSIEQLLKRLEDA